jgi:hypothetical protein
MFSIIIITILVIFRFLLFFFLSKSWYSYEQLTYFIPIILSLSLRTSRLSCFRPPCFSYHELPNFFISIFGENLAVQPLWVDCQSSLRTPGQTSFRTSCFYCVLLTFIIEISIPNTRSFFSCPKIVTNYYYRNP